MGNNRRKNAAPNPTNRMKNYAEAAQRSID